MPLPSPSPKVPRAVAALCLIASAWLAPPAHAADALRQAIDGPQRSPANRARDAARHPADTLRFFGLSPQQTVVEIAPGGGWYTEILAPYLRDHGRLVAAHHATDDPDSAHRRARAQFGDKLAQDPGVYGRVKVATLPSATTVAPIAPDASADLVLTFRNVHNWIEAGHLDESLRAFHAVLKPGGVLGVEEHRAPPGTPLARTIATGYVTEDFLVERAQAAGFELVARSEVNANPRDTHDHPDGVWSLPPVLRGGDVGRDAFLAIGESDRMTLKFRKRLR